MTSDPRPGPSAAAMRTAVEVALQEVSGIVPDESVDWVEFHARLDARATLPLARLRLPSVHPVRQVRATPIRRAPNPAPHAWWEYAARWSRVTVGASLAASAALIAVIRVTPKAGAEPPATGAATSTLDATESTRAAFESAVVGAATTTIHSAALMPNAAELLIPLGGGVSQ